MSASHLLHFDLSQGCTGRTLLAALIDLGASLKMLEKTLAPQNITLVYEHKSLDFLDASGRSLPAPISAPKVSGFKAKPLWHSRALPSPLGERDFGLPKSGEGSLEPIPTALFQKSKRILEESGHTATQSDLCELIGFAVFLAELDPGSVTATRIPLALAPNNPDRTAILKLSADIPVYEREWPAPTCDPVSLAMLKSCVANFGARGDSKLLKIGLSSAPEVRALWCQKEVTSFQKTTALLNISAQIANNHLISGLVHRLNQIGAKKIWTSQITDQGTLPRTSLHIIASEVDQNKIIEALLILGEASDVQVCIIEQHTLEKKVVSITLGRSQKQQVCRVTEYSWEGRLLRAEPFLEDLEALAKSSNQPQEIIRADVLSAWKHEFRRI